MLRCGDTTSGAAKRKCDSMKKQTALFAALLLMLNGGAMCSAATLTPENEDVALLGDVNDDGRIDNADLIQLTRCLNGSDTDINTQAADINRDTLINRADWGLLQHYVAHWDDADAMVGAYVRVTHPIEIVRQPASYLYIVNGNSINAGITCSGGEGSLTYALQKREKLSATDGNPPEYEWTTVSTLSRSERSEVNLWVSKEGVYRINVTDEGRNSAVTDSFTVVVVTELTTVTEPENAYMDDTSGKLKMTVLGGTAPYTFEWQYQTTGNAWKKIENYDNWQSMSGENTETISRSNFNSLKNSSGYLTVRCVVSDSAGASVTSHTIYVSEPLVITNPVNNVSLANAAVSGISVSPAGGGGPYTYQWQKRSVTVSLLGTMTETWDDVEGASKAVYKATSLGTYRCEIRDVLGNCLYSQEIVVSKSGE